MQAVHHVRNSTLSNPVYCNSVNELHHLKLCHKYLLELQNLDCLWCIFRLGAVSSCCILGWIPRLPKPSIVGFYCKRKPTRVTRTVNNGRNSGLLLHGHRVGHFVSTLFWWTPESLLLQSTVLWPVLKDTTLARAPTNDVFFNKMLLPVFNST